MDQLATLMGRRAAPEIEAETASLAKIVPTEEVRTGQSPFSWERSAGPEIVRETRGLNWTSGYVSGLGAAPGAENRGKEWWRKIGNAIIDWHCTRAHAVIGGAVTSIWLGPAGGAAATQATVAVQDMVCPTINAAASLVRHLRGEGISITRADAQLLIKNGEYVYDDKKGTWVRSTPMALLSMAVRPYLPYLAIAALAFGVFIAVRE